MGLLRRLFGRKKEVAQEPEPSTAPERGTGPEPVAPRPGEQAEQTLERLTHPDEPVDAAAIESAVSTLVAAGREMRAVDLLRRVSAARGDPPDLAHRVALILLARGNDADAAPLLEHASADPRLAADAFFRLGETHERAGRAARALECYERVLARDLDFPNARARAIRLGREVRPAASSAAPTLFSAEGAKVRGRFRLLRELGRGGAGAVYLAEDVRLGRRVALKVYHPTRSSERDPNRRLIREGRIAAAIRHPGVIRILDVLPDLHALLMEPLAGSLKDRLRTGVSIEEAISFAAGSLDVLAVLHGRRVVHRDVKPSNLLLRRDGRVVVTDFGVALVGDEDAEEGVVGTAGFIAPEVAAGAKATPASDVYAFGVILAELAGRRGADRRRGALLEIAGSMRAPDPELRPDALGALERIQAL